MTLYSKLLQLQKARCNANRKAHNSPFVHPRTCLLSSKRWCKLPQSLSRSNDGSGSDIRQLRKALERERHADFGAKAVAKRAPAFVVIGVLHVPVALVRPLFEELADRLANNWRLGWVLTLQHSTSSNEEYLVCKIGFQKVAAYCRDLAL